MVKQTKHTFTILTIMSSSVVVRTFSTICCFITLFKKVIYFWLHWVLIAVCGFLLWWFLLFWSLGSRLGASVVVLHGPSCSAARGTFRDQGSRPVCPALAGEFFPTGPPGKPRFIPLSGK